MVKQNKPLTSVHAFQSVEVTGESINPPKKVKAPKVKAGKPIEAPKEEEEIALTTTQMEKIVHFEKLLQGIDAKYTGLMVQVKSQELKNYVSQNKLDKAIGIEQFLKDLVTMAVEFVSNKVGRKTKVTNFLKNAPKIIKDCKDMQKEFLDQSSK